MRLHRTIASYRLDELAGGHQQIDYRYDMELVIDQKLAISNRVREEMQSLAIILEDQLTNGSSQGSSRMGIAAGMTRLRKIEFINTPERSDSSNSRMECRILEDSLLLRVRGRRYSSVAVAAIQARNPSPYIEIRIEHEMGVALNIKIPVRNKRPGCLSTGESTVTKTTARWFLR